MCQKVTNSPPSKIISPFRPPTLTRILVFAVCRGRAGARPGLGPGSGARLFVLGRRARAGPGAGSGPGGGSGCRLAPPRHLLLWGAADGAGAAPGAAAASGATPGAGVAAGAAPASVTKTCVSRNATKATDPPLCEKNPPPAVLKDLKFAPVQLRSIQLGDGVLQVTAGGKLNHPAEHNSRQHVVMDTPPEGGAGRSSSPLVFRGSVRVHKRDFTCFSHQVFQVLFGGQKARLAADRKPECH